MFHRAVPTTARPNVTRAAKPATHKKPRSASPTSNPAAPLISRNAFASASLSLLTLAMACTPPSFLIAWSARPSLAHCGVHSPGRQRHAP
eukprot:2199591-Pleurochrysis_carterae.AAC.1